MAIALAHANGTRNQFGDLTQSAYITYIVLFFFYQSIYNEAKL